MQRFTVLLALAFNNVMPHPQGSESVIVPSQNINQNGIYRRAISPDVVLKNGELAQKLNKKYASMTLDTPCKEGDKACIHGGFAQCVSGKYLSTGCAPPTACFELPLLLKAGSVPTCTTPADAAARIENSGAKGGVEGDGGSTAAPGNASAPAGPSPSANDTAGASSGASSDSNSTSSSTESTSIDDSPMTGNKTNPAPVEAENTSSLNSTDPASGPTNATTESNATDELPAKNMTNSISSNSTLNGSVEAAGNKTGEIEDGECEGNN